MSYFLFYMLFAVATSITSLYELVWPVLRKQEIESGKLESKVLYLFIFFCINILMAPVVFLSCIVPTWGVRFRIALQESLFDKD